MQVRKSDIYRYKIRRKEKFLNFLFTAKLIIVNKLPIKERLQEIVRQIKGILYSITILFSNFIKVLIII